MAPRLYFEAARVCARKVHELQTQPASDTGLKSLQSSDLSEHLLGIVSLEQARVTPERHDELLQDARRHMEAFIEQHPDRERDVLQDWAGALCFVARARQGAEVGEVMAEVFALLERAEPKGDSAVLQDQWAAILLGHARTRSGKERENLLTEADRHARLAQTMDAGRTYNLACISAQRGVLEDVETWLTRSCEGPHCQPLEHVLADGDFQVLPQNWLQPLVARLYPE